MELVYLDESEYDKLMAAIKPQFRFTNPAVEKENLMFPVLKCLSIDGLIFVKRENENV